MCKEVPHKVSLHNSHYYRRGIEGTRFDPDNCDALCFNCHRVVEKDRKMYTAWKRERLGDERFDALVERSKVIVKRDREKSLRESMDLLEKELRGS